jgi:hypothetical protein
MIAACETSALNSNVNNSAAPLPLLALLTQLTQQQLALVIPQPAVPQSQPTPRSELTTLLAQLAPLLQGPVTPGTATPHHSSPAPVAPAPSQQSQLHDLLARATVDPE